MSGTENEIEDNVETKKDESTKKRNMNRKRSILAQLLAGSAISLFVLGLGASMNVSTVIIATIVSGNDQIKATENELSWIGSLAFICQPIGSILSGALSDPVGRKKALIFINIPTIAAWLLTWWAQDVFMLLIANALFGFGTGLLEAPSISYIGEICEPSIRGIVLSYSSIFTSTGLFGGYFLGSVLSWRTTAAVFLILPLITLVAISLVPESPIWLLSRGRGEEALRSLCWLRGWVHPADIDKEFKDLLKYNKINMACNLCAQYEIGQIIAEINECPHKKTTFLGRLKQKMCQIFRRNTMKPLILVSLFFTFSTMTGLYSIRPILVNIFKVFNLPIDAYLATVGVGVLSILGSVLCCALVRFTGKRPLVLASMAGSSLSMSLLGKFAQDRIPSDVHTYSAVHASSETSLIPLVLFGIFVLCNATGIIPISWIIAAEVFPFKTRALSCGFTAALCYVMTFVASKTYINVERTFHIHGAFYMYSFITFVGLIYLYLALPETENRLHRDIEEDFDDDGIKIFANDCLTRFIKKVCKKDSNMYNISSNYDKNKRINIF